LHAVVEKIKRDAVDAALAPIEAVASSIAEEADTLDQSQMWDEGGQARHDAHLIHSAIRAARGGA
jgi:hypothetical protein